jgi:hypothetical protein
MLRARKSGTIPRSAAARDELKTSTFVPFGEELFCQIAAGANGLRPGKFAETEWPPAVGLAGEFQR